MKIGPLLACAIGDAYGAGFEYVPEHLPLNDLSRYLKHPRYPIGSGRYTDDTQMSIAVTECLLHDIPWERRAIAEQFFECFKRDPRPGYSAGFYERLLAAKDVDQLIASIDPRSERSGGAMRAAVVGLLPDQDEVIEKAKLQASITHNTLIGRAGAIVAALTLHYFHYQIGPKAQLGEWLDSIPSCRLDVSAGCSGGTRPLYWAKLRTGEVGALGYMAPHAAVTAIMQNDDLGAILKACIAFGGDVDTVAAIAMPAASRSVEVAHDLPKALFEGLENGLYGFGFLCELDAALLQRYPGAR